jgi:hypothetical protein
LEDFHVRVATQQPGALTDIPLRLISTSWQVKVKTAHVSDEGCQLLTPLLHFIIMPNIGPGRMFKQKSTTCCHLLPDQVFDKQHESLQLPSTAQNFTTGHVQGVKVEPAPCVSAWWTNNQKLWRIQSKFFLNPIPIGLDGEVPSIQHIEGYALESHLFYLRSKSRGAEHLGNCILASKPG